MMRSCILPGTMPDQEAPGSKTGHLGVRFVSVSNEHKSELQTWLSQKLEQILPDFVKFKGRTLLQMNGDQNADQVPKGSSTTVCFERV